jgi:hypothetical protein
MKTKDFVFDKKYDNYFLFLDNEIAINNVFYKRLKSFSSKNNGNELVVDLINLRESNLYKGRNIFKVPNSSPHTLEILSHEFIDENKTYEDMLFEFLIYDNTNEWAIYCHVGNDYGIGGCNDLLYNSFIEELNPYEIISFEGKVNEIEKSFVDESMKDRFIDNLFSTYNFKLI